MNNKIIFAVIVTVGTGVLSYFLYWHNYNVAKDAMYLTAPDFMLVYAQNDSNEIDRIKALTNYDKILRSIVDECSVKSIPLGNEMTLEERIGCIEIIDKMILGVRNE